MGELDFYKKSVEALDHEAFFSLGSPIYMSSNTKRDALNYNRFDVSDSTLNYLGIEPIDNSVVGSNGNTNKNTNIYK